MSFAAEMKDFVSSLGAVNQMRTNAAHRDYYLARAKALGGGFDYNSNKNEAANNPVDLSTTFGQQDTSNDKIPEAPEDIKKIIDTNVPEEMRPYAYRMAHKESAYNPDAVSSTGAKGLFQFSSGTGSDYDLVKESMDSRRRKDLRADPVLNTKAFVKLTQDNTDGLTKALGRAPTPGELAVAHQQGLKGAISLLTGEGTVDPYNLKVNKVKNAADIMKYYGFPTQAPAVSKKTSALPMPNGQQFASNSVNQNNADDQNDDFEEDQAIPTPQTYIGATGGVVQKLYEAGPVMPEANDEDPESEDRSNDYEDSTLSANNGNETAIGGSGNDTLQGNKPATLGDALHNGLMYLTKAFGLGQPSQAIGDDATLKNNQARLVSGEGGDPQGFEDMKKLTAKKGMNEAQANLTATLKGYEYYVNHGDPTKAAKYAAMAIQSAGIFASKYGDLAVKAGQKGDVDGMIDYAKKAYDYTLDGKQADAEKLPNGQIKVTQKDMDGNDLQTHVLQPRELINALMGLSNKSAYYDNVMQMAAQEPSVAARRLAMQQEQQNKVAGLGETLAHMDDGVTPQGNGDTALPVEKTNTNQSVAQPPVAQSPVAQPPASNTSAIPVNPDNLPVGGYTPIPKAVDETSTNPEVTEPKAIPTEGAGGDYSKIQVPVKDVPKPFPEPRPVMSPQKIAVLRDLVTQGPTGRALAMQEKTRFETEVVKPFLERQKAWNADQNASINSDYQAKVSTYNELIKNAGVANSNNSTDKLQKFIEKQANNRTQAQIDAAALLEKNRQDNALQLENFKRNAPVPFFAPATDSAADATNSERLKNVEDTIKNTIFDLSRDETGQPKLTDKNIAEQYSKVHLQGIRDAVIAVHRYNGGMPLDTAAQAVLMMTQPDKTILSQFKVEPIKGMPDDPTDGPRVKVVFNNPNSVLTGLILPKDVVTKLDILRGQQLQLQVNSANKSNEAKNKTAKQNEKLEEILGPRRAALSRSYNSRAETVANAQDNVTNFKNKLGMGMPKDIKLPNIDRPSAIPVN